MKKLFTILAFLSIIAAKAQTYNMSNTPVSTCAGTFFDNGGAGANYSDNLNFTETFTSDNGNRISFTFTSFATFNGNDYMRIYDGPGTSSPLIGTYSGGSSPGTVTSTGTSLTFTFTTNNAGSSAAGWSATISCSTPALTVYDMNTGTVNSCEGAFYDNGGSAANYPNNENREQTFCSDNGDFIQFAFNNNAFGLSGNDSLFVYDGANTATQPLAVFVASSFVETLTSTGTCLTFKFTSDGTGNSQGWSSGFSCTNVQPSATNYSMSSGIRYTCGGSFFDDGGAGGDYNDAVNRTQTFYSYNGNRISFNFTSFATFNGNDYMRIYDGPNTASPLIGTYSGGSSPGTVTSTGTSLTFTFNTNNAGSPAAGWVAGISCTTPPLTVFNMNTGTDSICSGAFYDNGGTSANYPNNENREHTFCSDNGEMIQFTFNNTAFGLSAPDSLFVYDGPNTSSSPLAVFVASSFVETLTSSGSCLTFKFTSDGTGNSQGWASSFSCTNVQPSATSYNMSSGIRYTCGGTFYDDGGAGGDYNDAVNRTQTFYSYNGNRISFNFTSFTTFNGNDYMRIYDGPNTSSPLIGTYSGGSSPGTVTSTGTSLTFTFNTNNAGSPAAGWAASISCTTPPLTVFNMNTGTDSVCSGAFYDNGGATANYPNNENREHTFCSDNGEMIQFTFNNTAFGLSAPDSLFVYDGPNTSSAPLAVFVASSFVETLTSTGSCLTFKFTSDGTGNSQGWASSFSCTNVQPSATNYSMSSGVRYTCGGTFYDDGGAGGDYNDAVNRTQTFYSYNGNRISFNFTSFATFNSSDYMRIYDGPNTTYPLIGTYSTGSSPGTVTSTGTSLTFTFNTNNAGSAAAGWAASISCTTPILTVYDMNTGTVNTCSGVFYDNGGANANYPNNENREQTFCSDNGEFIQFTFNNAAFGLSGNDSLFVYDGTNSSAQPLAVFVAGSFAETITSTGTCITFKFTSDGTTNSQGWQAAFACTNVQPSTPAYSMSSGIRYTCNAMFYDDGGAGGNYNDAANHTQTFISTGGCALRANFNSFATFNASDNLKIYDGPSTASTLIGTYSGSTSPGLVQASGNSLTFQFTTNNAGSAAAGWEAALSCPDQTAPPIVTNNSPVCEGDTIQFTMNNIPGATYSWTGPNGFTSTDENPQILNASGANAGTYSVVAVVGTCSTNQTISNLSVADSVPTPTVTNDGPVCSGSTLTLSCDTIAGATYIWTGPNGFSSTVQNPVIANIPAIDSGNYTVTAIVSVCSAQATTNVSVTKTPSLPVITSNSPLCENDNLNLTASSNSATSFSWTGPDGFTSTNQNPTINAATIAASGIYTVTAMNGSCTNQDSINISVNAYPALPTLTSNSPVCSGSDINLTSSSVTNATYSWNGPNGFISSLQNPTVTNADTNAGGTYIVTATVSGCSVQDSISVIVNQTPDIPSVSSNSPICEGDNLNLTSSSNNATSFSWTGPDNFSSNTQNPTLNSATVAANGIYTVIASNGNCSSMNQIDITVVANPAAPTLTSNSPVCEGSDINLTSSSITNATYSWTGPNGFSSSLQNPSISNADLNANGTYVLTASVGSCSVQNSINVIVTAIPNSPTATGTDTVCDGGTINLFASNVTNASYSWTGPNGFTSTNQNPTISGVSFTSAGTYSVVAIENGCSSSPSSFDILVNTVAPTVSSNGTVCEGDNIQLSASTISGANYNWTGPNGFNSSSQNPVVISATSSDAGTYSVTAIIGSCVSSVSTVSVAVNPLPSVPVVSSNSPVCEGAQIDLSASSTNGASYSWSGPDGFFSNQQNPSITPAGLNASGTYSVNATLNVCSSSSSTIVTVNNAPNAPTVSSNSPLCVGETLNLTASAINNATYTWTGPNGFTSSLQNPSLTNVDVNNSGTYSVIVTVNSCQSSAANVSVVVNSISSATASSNSPVCENSSLDLSITNFPGATYLWSGPNGFSSSLQNPQINNMSSAGAGTYSVTITLNSCSTQTTANVVVNALPATPTITESSGVLTSSSASGYQWYFNGTIISGATSQNYTPAQSGDYTVEITDGNGCISISAPYTYTMPAAYCTPTFTSGTNLGDFIDGVILGSIMNVGTGSNGGPSYNDYTNLTTTVTKSNSYSMSITGGDFGGDEYAAWIDYNGDGDFLDAGEKLGEFSTSFPNETQSINFTVPSSANSGSTRLRVRSAYNGTNMNPCNNYGYGEAEDYTVDIQNASIAPTANFTANTLSGCAPLTVNFTDVSTGNPSSWSWNFGDGTSSTLQNPSHTYTSTGTFTVTLTVTNGNGSDSEIKTGYITVNSTPDATINPAGPFCTGDGPVNLTAANIGGTWSGSGIVNANSGTFNPTVAGVGNHIITYIVTFNGCTATDTETITVNPNPAAPTITQNGGTLTSSSASGNQWFLNGNILNGETNQTVNAAAYGNGNYTVFVTNGFGCTAQSSPYNYTGTFAGTLNGELFSVNVFPNPNDGKFVIRHLPAGQAGSSLVIGKLEIYNLLGEVVYSSVIGYRSSVNIDLSKQGEGIYFVHIISPEKNKVIKIVVE